MGAGIGREGYDLECDPLVPKQQRKCYLIDSLSLALRHRLRFYAVFGHLSDSNLTQVFSSFSDLALETGENTLRKLTAAISLQIRLFID
jgi:hypothetical protein